MWWAKIIKFFMGTKDFFLRNKKVILILIVVAAVGIFFARKINSLKNEIDVLHNQIGRYQEQMGRDREDINNLNKVYSDAMERQEELIQHYHEDMTSLTVQYQQDMQQLRTDALGTRRRNSVNYSTSPSEGTQAISNRFGIPVGDRQ